MCARFTFLSYDEVADVVRELRMTSAPNPLPDWPAVRPSAYPKMPVTVIREAEEPEDGRPRALDLRGPGPSLPEGAPGWRRDLPALAPATLIWGFDAPWSSSVIFNTRVESAGKAFWRESLAERRCLVPCFGFYEPHRTETFPSPRTGKALKRQYYFSAPDGRLLLLAGLWKDDRFSVLTREPNATVAAVHDRMPLIVEAAAAAAWLGADYGDVIGAPAPALEARAVEERPLADAADGAPASSATPTQSALFDDVH